MSSFDESHVAEPGVWSTLMGSYEPDAPLDAHTDVACCEFYAPSEQQIAHLGARQSKHWTFTRAQVFPACTNPERNRAGERSCPFAPSDAPRMCSVFVPDPPEVLAESSTEKVTYRLECSRRNGGVPTYQMHSVTPNSMGEQTMLLWSLAGENMADQAQQEFLATVAEHGCADIHTPTAPEPESFFARLVS